MPRQCTLGNGDCRGSIEGVWGRMWRSFGIQLYCSDAVWGNGVPVAALHARMRSMTLGFSWRRGMREGRVSFAIWRYSGFYVGGVVESQVPLV